MIRVSVELILLLYRVVEGLKEESENENTKYYKIF